MTGELPFVVVVPTRERTDELLPTLDALAAQDPAPHVVVVDQTATIDERLRARAAADPRLTVVHDRGRGLSRARNIGWRAVDAPWVAFLDDDCRPAPDWSAELLSALRRHPDVAMVCGHVDELRAHQGDYVPVSAFPVTGEALHRGARVHPWMVGLGLSMTVRRSVVERLGGWDERLGAGTRPFPAAEDMDFNYRLLRSGATVLSTDRVRAMHHQWRSPEELPALYRNYMAGWCGFAMKHVRGGDVAGGLWLWSDGVRDAARMAASGVRRRSPLRRAIARQKLGGLVGGTLRGLGAAW